MAKDPRVRQIEQEASRRAAADGKSSHAERYAIRAELRQAQGLGSEKKKRGGVAGVWDRNKNVIKPALTIGAGLLTGGMAVPALIGAGIGGLDREGKGGIGFDAGGAVRGGIRGAAEGYAGQMLGSGIQGIRGALAGGQTPQWGFGEGVKMGFNESGVGRTLGKLGTGARDMVRGAVTTADGALDIPNILKGAAGALPIIQGMSAQRQANDLSGQQAASADNSNAALIELARAMMARGMGGLPGGGGGMPDFTDEGNPYASQFRPRVPAPPRM